MTNTTTKREEKLSKKTMRVKRWDFFAGPKRAITVKTAQEAYDLGHNDGIRYEKLDQGSY